MPVELEQGRAPSIVHVLPHGRPGGMREVALALHEGLPAHGLTSEVVLVAETMDRLGGAGRLPRLLRLVTHLLRRWRAERPDVVMGHAVYSALLVLAVARLAGVRRRMVVIHVRRETLGRTKTQVLRLGCLTGLFTEVVFCGEAVRETFRPLGRAVMARAVVIQNGIRLPQADPSLADQPVGERPDRARFVCAARLVEEKNVDTLVRAAARTSSGATVTVCGDGPDEARLRALASQLDVPVDWTGMISREELTTVYANATAFVFPSRLEGLPLVLIEAAAQGLPVIAGDRPFNREIMGDAARYVDVDDVDDVDAWARALDEVATSPELRARMAARGLERALLFTMDRMVDAYADLVHPGLRAEMDSSAAR